VKAVFDVTADARPGEVSRGLEEVARLLNLYGAAGLKAEDVRIVVATHGEADKAVLTDAAYLARFKAAANPNLPLIHDLKKAGMEAFVCGQSLHELGLKAEGVAEEVTVADAATLVLVNKQAGGYAYIPARWRPHGRGRTSRPGLNGGGSVIRGRFGGVVRPLRIASSASSSSSVVVTLVSTRFSGFGSPL
jgi:intracellular sulfur oxidation DsrE/DsrF family protein